MKSSESSASPPVAGAVKSVLWVSHGRVHLGSPAELLAPERLDEVYSSEGEPAPGSEVDVER